MSAKRNSSARLVVEALEDRDLLSTYIVNTPLDNPGDAELDGKISLREAITAANTNAPFLDATTPGQGGGIIDTITFDPGLIGKTIFLGGTELAISDNLKLSGLGMNALAVSGNAMSGVFVIDSDVMVAISEITIADGYDDYGAGILNEGGTLTIADTAFIGNTGFEGGGIFNDGGKVCITDSDFSKNVAETAYGFLNGGGAIWNNGWLEVRGGTFSNNSTESSGAGIFNGYGGSLHVSEKATFENNSSRGPGGAIINSGGFVGDPGSLDVANSIFTGNSGSSGGAIWNEGPANVDNNSFSDNHVRNWGGAVANLFGPMTLTNSTFTNNHADFYSGAVDNSGAIITISHSLFVGNTAGREGGAIENYFGRMDLSNSTISGNSSEDGGGLWNLGPLTVTNTTIFGNSADADGDGSGKGGGFYDASTTTVVHNTIIAGNKRLGNPDDIFGVLDSSSSHNLIGDAGTAGGLIHGKFGNIVGNAGTGTLDITKVLDTNLADNGGPTLTHALLPGGLAVDAGGNSLVDGPTDQRGAPRILDGDGDGVATVDIGAYELATPAGLVTYLEDTVKSLGEGGVLKSGEEKLLLALLAQAGVNLKQGNDTAAKHVLHAFVVQVERYVCLAVLSPVEGEKLIETAHTITGTLDTEAPAMSGSNAFFVPFELDWCIG